MRLLALFLLFLASFPAGAQRRAFFGCTGGAGLASEHGNESFGPYQRSLVTMSSEFYYRVQLRGPLYLRAGLGMGQLGWRSTRDVVNFDINGNVDPLPGTGVNRTTYFTLPLFVGASFANNRVFVQAGPWAAFLFRARYEGKNEQFSWETTPNQQYARGNGGIAAGAGVRLPMSSSISFTAEVRDQLGLINISDNYTVGKGSVRTNLLLAMIGIEFALGR